MEQLAEYIKDKFILNLLWQYLHRMGEGISRGCPLSPLIGAFFFSRMDARCRQDGLFYIR